MRSTVKPNSQTPCALTECVFAAFQNFAHRLPDIWAFETAGQVGDWRQISRDMRACIGNDDLIGIGVDDKVGVRARSIAPGETFAGQHALRYRLAVHFEGEVEDTLAALRDVDGERCGDHGLAGARPSTENRQLATEQTACHLVEVAEIGLDALRLVRVAVVFERNGAELTDIALRDLLKAVSERIESWGDSRIGCFYD